MSKAEIVAAMPDGLLELCWWCRTPDGAGRPCHSCLTCRQVDDALATRPIDPDPEPDSSEEPTPEHVCDECGKSAKTAGGLAAHRRSHS